jgi:hypothetical protein
MSPPPAPLPCPPAETFLEQLLLAALNSSCTSCLDGSSPWGGCQRCLPAMGKSPHNPRASFYRTVEVLVAHGLQATPRLMRHLQLVGSGLVGLRAECMRVPLECLQSILLL